MPCAVPDAVARSPPTPTRDQRHLLDGGHPSHACRSGWRVEQLRDGQEALMSRDAYGMRYGVLTAVVMAATTVSALPIDHHVVAIVQQGLPAVRCDRVYQAVLSTDGSFNEIVYWSRLPDWKNQLFAPDPNAIYVLPFLNM